MEQERQSAKRKEAELQKVASEVQQLRDSVDKEEELRVLKISYDKMLSAKDKEIAEVEERLREALAANNTVALEGSKQELEATLEVKHPVVVVVAR